MSDYAYWKERAGGLEHQLTAANARIAELEMAAAAVAAAAAPHARTKKQAEEALAEIHAAVEGDVTPNTKETHDV